MSYYQADLRWHGYYVAPRGVEGEPCWHRKRREGTGPWPGKPEIGFTADVCQNCGRIMRSVRDITWQEYFWVRRFNASKGSRHE